ncbi:hypothetical protein Lalb_Chr08g0232031 [Lupinus albus]|uniref:Uncharacterized protein n=1 Tax=Lupinus albus TaxID=3870 RepID=A0A6A4Q2V1_LUPAL|nr:hypothetical protein Lalb_Chr08g0232031 [Lupinus albus]
MFIIIYMLLEALLYALPYLKCKYEAYVLSETEGGKYEKIQEIGQSKTNNSIDNGNENENSGGPISQVIKVAIIIGFGILVFFTRQRNTRYENWMFSFLNFIIYIYI